MNTSQMSKHKLVKLESTGIFFGKKEVKFSIKRVIYKSLLFLGLKTALFVGEASLSQMLTLPWGK